ncbi:MAG TPA: NEW3 domain-containing protein, partial [Candidatus Acidoferrum sp.]
GTFIGEDHGDHQAAGVLATEAFDLSGDPTVFPEQISAPLRRLEPYLENLRPWQTKKIYYFPDADKEELFRDKGPKYSVKEISKSAKQAYWRVALESFRRHETQAKSFIDSLAKMDEAQIEKMVTSDSFWSAGISFVLGKSLVGGSVSGDIFEGVAPGAIPFARPQVSPEPSRPEISVELAGPWNYYAEFRRAHALTHLPHADPPEIALEAGTDLVIPLWLHNQSSAAEEISLTVNLPAGWSVESGRGAFTVAAKQTAATRIEVKLPPFDDAAGTKPQLQEVRVHAEANGQAIGDIKFSVELRKRALPE